MPRETSLLSVGKGGGRGIANSTSQGTSTKILGMTTARRHDLPTQAVPGAHSDSFRSCRRAPWRRAASVHVLPCPLPTQGRDRRSSRRPPEHSLDLRGLGHPRPGTWLTGRPHPTSRSIFMVDCVWARHWTSGRCTESIAMQDWRLVIMSCWGRWGEVFRYEAGTPRGNWALHSLSHTSASSSPERRITHG